MKQSIFLVILTICLMSNMVCFSGKSQTILPGAYQTEAYFPFLQNKRIAIVGNHTSLIGNRHLVDTLISVGITPSKVFCPEHGFRGDQDAGALINNSVDKKTGIPIISLYGQNKMPKDSDLKNIDIVLFDLQDVGVRFFTYISTLYYIMESCVQHDIQLIVLDRPNPNGDYVAGPVLDMKLKSFVGIVPVPIVYGLTIGELATMINKESWLSNKKECKLMVIHINNWDHNTAYDLPIKPSPNLPNYQSIRWYPSLCLFEGTNISIGRGTQFPFQVIGSPDPKMGSFTFTPRSMPGMSSNPKLKNQLCYGIDLRNKAPEKFNVDIFMSVYNMTKSKKAFLERKEWIKLLIGDPDFIEKIEGGMKADQIEKTWQDKLALFKEKRKNYLLYPDFK